MDSESHLHGTDKLNKFMKWRSLRVFYVLLVVFLIALLLHSDLAPLEETHWDAPIYVELSKQAAETDMLADYHEHARDIEIRQANEVYWNFTRIGHILLLGEVVKLFGATETALVAMQWLYRIFMALGVTLCVVLGLRLVTLLRPGKPDSILWAGYLIAALTYIVSDSYRGLQGHLVSEPPAFLILVLFALMLLRTVELRSLAIGAGAGCLLFLLFFIRMDAILPAVVFLIMLLAVLVVSRKFDAVLRIVVAGLISFILYLTYAWWFSPLANPQTLANFSSEVKEWFPGAPANSLFAIVIAGGLLWVGACAAVLRWRDPVVRFAIIWLGLALLPVVIDSLNGRAIQVRMAFFIVLPLLILSGEGWAWMLRSFIEQRKIRSLVVASGFMMILAFVPYSPVIQESRNFVINYVPPEIQKYLLNSLARTGIIAPAGQHQDAKLGLLVRPISQRRTLEYSKAREIGEYLYVPERPAYLLWSRTRLNKQQQYEPESYIRVFQYFGKKYSENSNFILTKFLKEVNIGSCAARTPTTSEPVIFCTTLDSQGWEVLRRKKIPLYILGIDGYPMPDMPQLELTVLLSVPPFVLYGIAE